MQGLLSTSPTLSSFKFKKKSILVYSSVTIDISAYSIQFSIHHRVQSQVTLQFTVYSLEHSIHSVVHL